MSKDMMIQESLRSFAQAVTSKMSQLTPGEPEDQLRAPFENFMAAAARALGWNVVSTGETRLPGRLGKPDYAVHLNKLLAGYVELKAPGVGANPKRFSGHNRNQWKRFQSIPNLLYCDGNEWGLYRSGKLEDRLVRLSGDIATGGKKAVGPDDAHAVERLLREFFSWRPIIPSDRKGKIDLKGFAELLAPLCRMLREDVTEALQDANSPLVQLARDWRQLLFPDASDSEFADAYGQTVTFALLLGRSERADPLTLASAEAALAAEHSLLSRALRVLTDPAARAEISASLDLLLRIMAVVPPATLSGPEDPWLYFYEDFLAAYDPKLRKDAGAYYTPVEVVRAQVRLIDDLLVNRLGRPLGFADPGVVTLDPAAGTGTYLLGVIQHALGKVETEQGAGAIPGQATALAANLYGFEKMVGPFAVTELRVSRALRDRGATLPDDGSHIYLTDTLESPHAQPPQLPLFLKPIAEQHAKALKVKSKVPVIVCLGNPPYDRHPAAGEANKARTGGWVRWGDDEKGQAAIFRDFLEPAVAAGHGLRVHNLYNLYVYFWRWALWKVLEQKIDRQDDRATSDGRPGVVSFISASSYLDGDAFCGMREHMRRTCDEIWILDLGGEGRGTRKTDNVFAIQTPVAIAVALRAGTNHKSASRPPRGGTGFQPVNPGLSGHTTSEHGDTAGGGTGFQPVNCPQDAHPTSPSMRHGAYLPHWTKESSIYSVTFRLADSLPQTVVEAWISERENIIQTARQMGRPLSNDERKRLQYLFSEKVDKHMDAGHGACWMKRGAIARMVADALQHFDGQRYHLLAWCVMPNHVHVIVQPLPGHKLPDILHSWKSYSANKANKALGRKARSDFWQPEYYDHLIRDENDLAHSIQYVLRNPRIAGLKNWKWVGGGACRGGTGFQPVDDSLEGLATPEHGQDAHATSDQPAKVHYACIEGSRQDKLGILDAVRDFTIVEWRDCPDDWQAPFRPAGEGKYFDWPLLTDLMPWQHSGVQLKRTWPIAPNVDTLQRRWQALLNAEDRSKAFRGTGDREIEGSYRAALTPRADSKPIAKLPENAPMPPAVGYAYRSFDRQSIIADGRLMSRPRPDLWRAHGERQAYFTSLFSQPLGQGPSLTASACIPDLDHFRGSYGAKAAVPFYRNAAATEANILPNLLDLLGKTYKRKLTPEDFLAYVYGALAQPAFTARFAKELETRELRVPITKDAALFVKVRDAGARLLWLHTYGERFAGSTDIGGTPRGGTNGGGTGFQPVNHGLEGHATSDHGQDTHATSEHIPRGEAKCVKAVPGDPDSYPDSFEYNDVTQTLHVGNGEFRPVAREVFEFEVSGLKVVQSWLKYRIKKGAGKKSSPLDDIRPERWTSQFTTELLELLWVLQATIAGYPQQAKLLQAVIAGPCFLADELPDVPEEMRKPPAARPSAQTLLEDP